MLSAPANGFRGVTAQVQKPTHRQVPSCGHTWTLHSRHGAPVKFFCTSQTASAALWDSIIFLPIGCLSDHELYINGSVEGADCVCPETSTRGSRSREGQVQRSRIICGCFPVVSTPHVPEDYRFPWTSWTGPVSWAPKRRGMDLHSRRGTPVTSSVPLENLLARSLQPR